MIVVPPIKKNCIQYLSEKKAFPQRRRLKTHSAATNDPAEQCDDYDDCDDCDVDGRFFMHGKIRLARFDSDYNETSTIK